ncbi:MAG: rhodanese-like domain-containing protein [Tepidisphaeraceae bacterium]|jgi:rhodanese-related sulfurtransferase
MSVATISATELAKLIQSGRPCDLIDVRTPGEFAGVHAAGARLVPLDTLDVQAVLASRQAAPDQPVYLICKAGSRGKKACEKFIAAGCVNVVNVEGGTDAWVAAGLSVERSGSGVIALDRQVRIAAGSLVLLGALLAWKVAFVFIGLSAFVGAGLVFSGITDTCGMAMLLARMPWNRATCGGACSCTAHQTA